ncbi:MAG: aldo/keto reductase, partial [Angustibacter sp.]
GAIRSTEALAEDDFRRFGPRLQGEAMEQNLALVDALTSIAEELSCSLAQLALAWVLAQGSDVIPIPGTRNPGRLAENLAAAALQLGPAQLDRIAANFPVTAVQGERYPDMSSIDE